ARATAVQVSLRRLDGGVQLAIRDNGASFDPAQQRDRPSLGHASMRQRIYQLNGELEVESAPGHGTTVLAWVPLKNRPRVLLADDHRMVAEGLKGVLADEFEVVGVVEDGRAMVAAANKLQPDVIVADISMPHLNGIDALPRLKKDNPDIKVVFLTMH